MMERLYSRLDSYNVPTEVMIERYLSHKLKGLVIFFSNHDDCDYTGTQYYEENNDVLKENF